MKCDSCAFGIPDYDGNGGSDCLKGNDTKKSRNCKDYKETDEYSGEWGEI